MRSYWSCFDLGDLQSAVMNQSAILWLLGMIITVQVIVVGFIGRQLWDHIKECREVQRTLGALSTLPDEIQRMRKHMHDYRNELLRILARVDSR